MSEVWGFFVEPRIVWEDSEAGYPAVAFARK